MLCRHADAWQPTIMLTNWTHRLQLSDCLPIGATEVIQLSPEMTRAIQKTTDSNVVMATTFCRATVQGETFYSKSYQRSTARNNYTVSYYTGDGTVGYGYIQYFLSLTTFSVAVITPLIRSSHSFPSQLLGLHDCFHPVITGSSLNVVPVVNLLHKFNVYVLILVILYSWLNHQIIFIFTDFCCKHCPFVLIRLKILIILIGIVSFVVLSFIIASY